MDALEQQQQAEDQARQGLAAEIFPSDGGVDAEGGRGGEYGNAGTAPDGSDEWAGVSPALRQTIEALNSRMTVLDSLDHRLKSTEGRVGSLQNMLRQEQQRAERERANAPTPEQIEKAKKTEEAWKKLTEEFPDWAPALQEELKATRQETGDIRQRLAQAPTAGTEIMQQTLATFQRQIDVKLLTFAHPDWRQTVSSKAFNDWLSRQSADVQNTVASSTDPIACIGVLTAYKGGEKAGNAGRLERAASLPSGRNERILSPDSMDEAQYRAYLAKQMWG